MVSHATMPFALGVTATALRHPQFASELDWSGVTLAAATTAFPTEQGKSHYYAARETDALPLRVGSQSEKFLFYRGVANFDVPLSARAARRRGRRAAEPRFRSDSECRPVRAARIVVGVPHRRTTAQHDDACGAVAHGDSRVASRRPREMLIDAGLYPREASAMLETWRDSWFEDGTRVFYVVPRTSVDAILPLTITPAPTDIKRVFVGRMELVTPAVQQTVESAITDQNSAVLERYARFLGPITDRILATRPGAADAIRSATSAAYASYVKRSSACE